LLDTFTNSKISDINIPIGMNAQPLLNIKRLGAIVTETRNQDLNGSAKIGVVRLLAAHIDAAFSEFQCSLIQLDEKIDRLEQRLDIKVTSLEQKLSKLTLTDLSRPNSAD